jgi:hypothetical protein
MLGPCPAIQEELLAGWLIVITEMAGLTWRFSGLLVDAPNAESPEYTATMSQFPTEKFRLFNCAWFPLSGTGGPMGEGAEGLIKKVTVPVAPGVTVADKTTLCAQTIELAETAMAVLVGLFTVRAAAGLDVLDARITWP